MTDKEKKKEERLHEWVQSTLGHGLTMCKNCLMTHREAAVLGKLNQCDRGD